MVVKLSRHGHSAVAVLFLGVALTCAQERGNPPSSEAVDNIIDEKISQLTEQIRQLELLRGSSLEIRQLSLSSKDQHSELDGVIGRNSAEEAEGKAKGGKELGESQGGESEASNGEGGSEGEETEVEEELEEPFTAMDLTCGICLLCFITFNMTLYYLVNWPDPDMQVYVWTVISRTICIFVAIFVFSSVDVMLKYLTGTGRSEISQAALAFFQVAVWFISMQATVAYVSGGMEQHPFTRETSIESQKKDRSIRFQSFASLLAHICGFAAINAGGCLQHMYPFNINALTLYAVPLIMFINMLIVGRTVKMIRTSIKDAVERRRGDTASYSALTIVSADPQEFSKEEEHELVDWCLEQWEEETYEVELDVAGLAVSFVLVQACRFSVTGIMPNNLGIEEEHFIHPSQSSLTMLAIGAVFAMLCVLCVLAHYEQKKYYPVIMGGTLQSTVKRMILTGRMSFAMSFAWCLFTASKWEITRLLPQFNPNGVVSRVLLAMAIAFIVFIVILILDYLADMESTGEVADGAIITLIYALATLVGFSFEQSFDGAVEALAEKCFIEHEVMADLILAILVCVIVYPAWRKYILRTLYHVQEVLEKGKKA